MTVSVNVVVSDTVGQNNARFSMPNFLEAFTASTVRVRSISVPVYGDSVPMCLCDYVPMCLCGSVPMCLCDAYERLFVPIDLHCYQKLSQHSTCKELQSF
jgi:hypothetical protein